MVKNNLYVEGGGDSKELHARCREGFRKLLERCGYTGRMPRLVACGGRGAVFDDFTVACGRSGSDNYIAMLIDSEDPLTDSENIWEHVKNRDGWEKPAGATDEQVLLMTTCMETWIIADRDTLKAHYGTTLQVSALPPLVDLEQRSRHGLQDKLVQATRHCANAYAKGKRSFEILAKLSPDTLKRYLPSFVRDVDILNRKL